MSRKGAACNSPDDAAFEGMAEFGCDDGNDEFGYLYRSRPYGLVPNMDSTDQRIMEPRSGGTGYRGSKPAFGDEGYGEDSIEVGAGPGGIWYKGDNVTALALAGLGVAAIALAK